VIGPVSEADLPPKVEFRDSDPNRVTQHRRLSDRGSDEGAGQGRLHYHLGAAHRRRHHMVRSVRPHRDTRAGRGARLGPSSRPVRTDRGRDPGRPWRAQRPHAGSATSNATKHHFPGQRRTLTVSAEHGRRGGTPRTGCHPSPVSGTATSRFRARGQAPVPRPCRPTDCGRRWESRTSKTVRPRPGSTSTPRASCGLLTRKFCGMPR
jgi:hypothetical protein